MEDWPGIIRRHTAVVWETVSRLLGTDADAADAFQETFVAAVALARRQKVRNWEATLRHLATARAIDGMRRRIRERGRIEGMPEWELMVGPERDPSAVAEERELIGQLRALVAELPVQQAEAYCLRFIQGWSYEQISEVLDMKVNAVGVMLSRTRARMIELMGARGLRDEVKHGE